MTEVDKVELNITLPDEGFGMVIMQPFVELCHNEPFRWQDSKKNNQIDRIVRTLEIAEKTYYGSAKTHFTVLPEFAIPGLEGVRKIQEILESGEWKDGMILVGGVDGLNKSEYSTLCSENNTEVHQLNKPDKVQNDQWVNCCITWAKETDGALRRWVQPKLSPSWPERNFTHNQMFAGRSVYVFSGKFENQTDCRFLSLICFDWIGPIGQGYGIWEVLLRINNSFDTRRELNIVFVLQFNDEPNHRDFLENARYYFERRTEYQFINRNEGIILFSNTAGGFLPRKYRNYGYSSLIFSPLAPYDTNGCPPTYALKTHKLRSTDSLGRCKEALFREMGACLHSFKFRLPQFVNLEPRDRCWPIDEAIVHAIDDGIDDPRTSSKPVPASVKWINDQLDEVTFLLANKLEHPLRNYIARAHLDISSEIRKQAGDLLCRYIVMSSYEIEQGRDKYIKIGEHTIHNIDNWDENETKALETVVYSLEIMKACKPLEVSNSPAHATIKIQDKVMDVIIVSGKTHEACYEYAMNQYQGSGQRFVLVITHDRMSSLPKRNRKFSIVDVEYENSQGPHIADPNSRVYHWGYQNLIDSCVQSQSLQELDGKISAIMGL